MCKLILLLPSLGSNFKWGFLLVKILMTLKLEPQRDPTSTEGVKLQLVSRITIIQTFFFRLGGGGGKGGDCLELLLTEGKLKTKQTKAR